MVPSRSPIHFTNELEVAVSPETIWSLLVDTANWPLFYPGVQKVQLLDGHKVLQAGTRFETNLAGQDVYASVQEFEPITRLAWGAAPSLPRNPGPTTHGSSPRRPEVFICGLKRPCKGRSGLSWRREAPTSSGERMRSFFRTSRR
jgi:hypothetical protein